MQYGLQMYGGMLGDKARVDSHTRALARAVRPGSTVIDLGAGFGYFSILACRFGARHVYAIEPADSVLLGRELAELNGCGDRITFIHDLSTAVTLPERVDVVFCDLRGASPLFARSLASIIDARTRLLAPDGVLVPFRDTVHLAAVDDRAAYVQACRPWQGAVEDVDLAPVERMLQHSPIKRSCSRASFLARPQPLLTLEYAKLESPNVSGTVCFSVEHAGTLHGFAKWFDAELAEGIGFSTGPFAPPTTYGQFFFPISDPPRVEVGDKLEVTLLAESFPDDYCWSWRVTVTRGNHVVARREQSSFHATVLGLDKLKRSAPSFVPALNDAGSARQFVLGSFGSGKSVAEIAREARERFPQTFATLDDAMGSVSELSRRFSR